MTGLFKPSPPTLWFDDIDNDFVVLLLLADVGVINPYKSLSLPKYGCKESDRSLIPLWWGGWE